MDNNLQKNQEFLRLSKIKIKSLVNDELFFEVIEKELKIEQIDTENELIILSLDNKFVLNQFIENYLNDFNKIFNSISENKYVLTFDGVKQNTSTYKTEIYGVNKEMNFNNITVGQFNEVAILYGKKIANDKS
jgi:chromosomal replication initiation ATPase DnaA